eukprot:1677650-Lingulodinium_polyedra.AAC.1
MGTHALTALALHLLAPTKTDHPYAGGGGAKLHCDFTEGKRPPVSRRAAGLRPDLSRRREKTDARAI